MASPSDLAALAAVKAWLSVDGTNSDALLASLITVSSRMIYAVTGRPTFLPTTFNERYDGLGYPQRRVFARNFPVISVVSLAIDNVAIPAAPTPQAGSTISPSGYLLEPWDGNPPGQVQAIDVFGYQISRGRQNILLSTVCGYQVTGEAQTVPAGASAVTSQPFGAWAADAGVIYAATGVALTKVSSAPAVGQYAVDQNTPGQYDFAAADIGQNVLISYGFVPQDIAQVCVELVGERYRYRTRIGEVSKSLGGQETMSFSQKSMSDAQKMMLQPYMRVAPI